MAKKQFFLIIDTESTINDHCADFGAMIVDKQGNIHKEIAILVGDFYQKEQLFFDKNAKEQIWQLAGLKRRGDNYINMVNSGQRLIASVNAINRWLDKANMQYSPELTAYNLPFDLRICENSGIDLSMFEKRFCLWQLAIGHYGNTKKYKNFILQNHAFNSPTDKGNMTFKTNAEIMASFINGAMLPPEPHTALEDIKFYELPILQSIIKKRNWREKQMPYNWQSFQVKDHFVAI